MTLFTDDNIARMFGTEAAEDEKPERLKEWFIRNKAYDSVRSTLPIRILVGHKGVGKSALLKMSHLEDRDHGIVSVMLQPNDLQALVATETAATFLQLIELWKSGLRRLIIGAIARAYFEPLDDEDSAVKSALFQFGKAVSSVFERVQAKKLESIDAAVLNFSAKRTVRVYIDDIDRGWSASKQDIQNVSALVNAIRDLTNELRNESCEVHFRIGLRTDVYHLVRTSDESTDKSQGYLTWLQWNNHDILLLIVKRVLNFQGELFDERDWEDEPQEAIAQNLKLVIETRFKGAGKWSNAPIHRVLLSLTRRRPRDLIKLLTSAAKEAQRDDADLIATKHLKNVFESYSRERLQDVINEFRSELPAVEYLVHGMRPTAKEKKDGMLYIYSQDRLLKKITNLMSNNNYRFTNKQSCTAKSLAEFLYKIDFITGRKGTEDRNGKIVRKYFEEHQSLLSDFADYGFDWEVHMAYRWALQPDNIDDIFKRFEVPETD